MEACKNVPVEVKKQMVEVLSPPMESSKRRMRNEEEEGMAETVPDKKGKRVIESFGIRTISTTESILNQNFEKKLRDEACPTSC